MILASLPWWLHETVGQKRQKLEGGGAVQFILSWNSSPKPFKLKISKAHLRGVRENHGVPQKQKWASQVCSLCYWEKLKAHRGHGLPCQWALMQNVTGLLGKPIQDIAVGWGMFSLAGAPFLAWQRRHLSFFPHQRFGFSACSPPAAPFPPPACTALMALSHFSSRKGNKHLWSLKGPTQVGHLPSAQKVRRRDWCVLIGWI